MKFYYGKLVVFLMTVLLITQTGFTQTLKGKVLQESFYGNVTKKTVYYNIYLPEGYDSSTDKYPVVYQLHGLNETRGGVQNTIVPQYFENALASGIIGKVIIVFPEGYSDSFWGDSKDGSKPAETNLIKELIPHVDSVYRTIPKRTKRIIQGFSMGGFGAAKFASKYPELFSTAVLYDAAILKWTELKLLFPAIASGVFANDEAYFDQYSPWYWTQTNKNKMFNNINVKFVVGQYPTLNKPYRDLLNTIFIPLTYVETGCSHDLACLFSKEGINSAKFIAQNIAGYKISGKITYANTANSPMPLFNFLLIDNSSIVTIIYADNNGNYTWPDLANGTYLTMLTQSNRAWGGVNSTDALQIRRYLTSAVTLDSLQMLAADINNDGQITSTDALLLRRRLVGVDSGFSAGDWILTMPTYFINGADVVKDIKCICRGDVNSSYIP